MVNSSNGSHWLKFGLLGALFGMLFPLGATILQTALRREGLSLEAFGEVQKMPLMWMSDTAPIFLGWFAAIAGVREDRLQKTKDELALANRELEANVQALEEANQGLVRASTLKSQFLANMSHELRTPLNAIIGFSRILLRKTEGKLPERQAKNLKMVNDSGHHLLALVNDMLDIERIEAGMIAIKVAPIVVRSLAEDVISRLAPAAAAKGLRLVAEADSVNVVLNTDELRLRQVLDNLVNNAIKYSDTGTITLRVKQSSSETLVFEVADEGLGIDEAMVTKIFEPFLQIDGSSTRAQGGVGLGLHLVSKIVDLLGGRVSVESEKGKGSVFSVSLPLQAAENDTDRQEQGELDLTKQGEGPAVLVVDDTPAMIELLRSDLIDAGFCVHVAMNGKEGLAKALAVQPTVILLDIIMPVMDGWGMLKELKKSPKLSHIPVVITSQLDNSPDAEALGVAGWLTKPTSPEAFQKIFNRIALGSNDDILLVEDDAATSSLVEQHLIDVGLRCRTARSGPDAIRELAKRLPHAVVLDLMLPELDGFAVFEHLRAQDGGEKIPVVVYTAKDLNAHERGRLNIGPVEIVGKGRFDSASSMVALVRSAVQRHAQ